jgi:UDP-3-O-acyl N-acetylglucosamine deacetylase
VVLYGVGLHSGARTGLILQPLPPGSGIHFIALPSGTDIPAHLSSVASGGFATTLGKDGVTVRTVEHFLAACHAFGVTNLLVKVQGEIPVMDGSALEFCKIFLEAGIEDQGRPIPPVVIRKEYTFGSAEPGKKHIVVRPCDHLRVTYRLSYPPPVGDEEITFDLREPEDFVREIAPARTFGFMKDIGELEKMGLGSGGRLNNFILIGEEEILNTTLRFPKEFSRHKILDILGDFYLLGRPLLGEIRASLTGHTENQAMLREIAKDEG